MISIKYRTFSNKMSKFYKFKGKKKKHKVHLHLVQVN
jgi:hypothetical protein